MAGHVWSFSLRPLSCFDIWSYLLSSSAVVAQVWMAWEEEGCREFLTEYVYQRQLSYEAKQFEVKM